MIKMWFEFYWMVINIMRFDCIIKPAFSNTIAADLSLFNKNVHIFNHKQEFNKYLP
jgi:hypothetical protein